MAINRTSPKKGKVVDIPTAPTIGTATAGGGSATVAYTAATKGGPATTYTALSSPGSFTGTGSSSPITVSGLTAGTAYTFTVRGNNATGYGEYSLASNSITALANTSYESIATVTLTGNTQNIVFSSIPSTYKHLEIRFVIRDTYPNNTPGLQMLVNGGAFTSNHNLAGNGSSVSANGASGGSQFYFGFGAGDNITAGIYSAGIIRFHDYSNTNKYKTFTDFVGCDINATSGSLLIKYSGMLDTTSAISSIEFKEGDTNFKLMAGTKIALYGIKGA